MNRRKFLDPNGEVTREPQVPRSPPRATVHIDVKKVGRIPDGGGERAHGRGSEQGKSAERIERNTSKRGYVYPHSAVDGYSRLAYTEALPDENATTAIAFLHRTRAWSAAHGTTHI